MRKIQFEEPEFEIVLFSEDDIATDLISGNQTSGNEEEIDLP